MFELKEHSAKIANVNFRAEKHGNDNVTACDIKIEVDVHHSVLAEFNPLLSAMLFREPGTGDQLRLEGVGEGEADKRTECRLPRLAPLKWDEDFPGYKMVIPSGLGLKKPLELEVELSSFVFEAHDGGTVAVTFRASGHPGTKESGALADMIQEDIELTLIAPAVEEKPQQALAVDAPANDREKVIVAKVLMKYHKGRHLTKVEVTLSDDRVIDLDEVAYTPDQEQVADLLRFKGFEPEFTPACLADAWPAKAA